MLNKTSLITKRISFFLRWIYAIFFLLIGARALLILFGFLPPTEYPGSPEVKAFTHAIFETGFISPLMSVTYFVAGILILIKRTAPLGLILLAPFIVSILLTHLMFEPNPMFGIFIFLWWLFLAWQFRSAFQPMWNYQSKA